MTAQLPAQLPALAPAAVPSRPLATAIGAAGVVLWATETSLAKGAAGLPPFEIVGCAFLAAALLSPPVWWLTGQGPGAAFRQRPLVWLVMVPCLVLYHACIYAFIQRAPAMPAALMQGSTPLVLVVGTALLPGSRLRWWHWAALVGGLEGVVALAGAGEGSGQTAAGGEMALVGIGFAAALWGVYSLAMSRLAAVPVSALGVFYLAAALAALACHAAFESWVTPSLGQLEAVAGLGLLPMGLAILCWNHGLAHGDVPALGGISYVEPLVGATLTVALGQGVFHWSTVLSGLVLIGAAMLGSADLLDGPAATMGAAPDDP